MKNIRKVLFFGGIASFGLAYLMFYVVRMQSSLELLSMPFDWIGNVLRWLSLSSSIGNMIALVCYIILSLSPIIYLLLFRRKAGIRKIDILLPVISIYLFYLLYVFINQGLMLRHVPQRMADTTMLPVVKLTLVIVFYSLLIGYMMIRMLGTLSNDGAEDRMQFLCNRLQKILLVLSALYTFFIGYFAAFQMFANLNKYAVTTTSFPIYNGQLPNNSVLDQFMVILTFLLQCLPIVYSIMILINGAMLLDVMTSHHLKEEEYKSAAQLSNISKKAVYVTVLSNLGLNTVQFLLSSQLSDTAFKMEIILSPLIIAFSAMILSGYFKETKELQEDNEMII